MFRRLLTNRWRLKLNKCEFGSNRMEYLGFTISSVGLHPSGEKVRAVRDFPVPKSWERVASFLGLVGYYRRFIKGFAAIAQPLQALGHKGCPWTWEAPQERSFRTLQGILLAEPVLQFPNFERPFVLQTDASYSGMGAVLSQLAADGQDHAVAYASRALRGAERHYSATDRGGGSSLGGQALPSIRTWPSVPVGDRSFGPEGLDGEARSGRPTHAVCLDLARL